MDDVELNRLFARIDQGDVKAAEALLPMVYDELHRLAAAKLGRELAARTFQPTALVHEAWLRLGGDQQPTWKGRAHFFGAAAEAMRRILIEHARSKQAHRRGGGATHLSLDKTGLDLGVAETADEELLLLDEALQELAARDPRRAELVKLRYFVGLNFEEVAKTFGVSLRTAKRDWSFARAWLHDRIDTLRARPD